MGLVHPRVDNHDFELKLLNTIFYLLLSLKHYNLVEMIFNSKEPGIDLKEVLKPTYYAFLYLHNGPESVELLKAGSELREPVQMVLEKVKKMDINNFKID